MTKANNKILQNNYPTFWYPMGAGGMWVNYLVWCWHNKKNILGHHLSFEYDYLKSLDPSYSPFFTFRIHAPGRAELQNVFDDDYSQIKLGSSRAYGNFFINILEKKGMYPNWQDAPFGFWAWHDGQLEFNLDWCDIFHNPCKFLEDLNRLSNNSIQFDSITEFAFQQYKDSCAWMYNKESLSTNVFYQAWKNFCLERRTDASLDLDSRLLQAQEMVEKTVFLP